MIALVVLLFLMPGKVEAAERPEDFAFGIAIKADASDALQEIEIPAAVYHGITRSDLGDIRIFNGQGEVVPHALRPRVAIREETSAPVRLPAFPLYGESRATLDDLNLRIEKRSDGTIIDIRRRVKERGQKNPLRGYLLDASALKPAIQALQFDWQSAADGFVGTIRIEGSDDLAAWATLADNAALASLTFGGQQVRRNRVELRVAKYQYLRVLWPDSQPGLVSLTALAVPATKTVASPRLWQAVTGLPVSGKTGDYNYDLGGHFIFDRLRVELPQLNSLVQLQILSRAATSEEWRPVTRAVVYRLRARDIEVTSPEIIVPGNGERYWLLRVDPKGGGIGSGVPAMQIGWVPQKLVFTARGAGPFQLAYGSSSVKPSAFAIESLIPGYRTDAEFTVQSAVLGEPVTLAGAARLRPAWDYKKIALWASLILGVALLGWMAYRLLRQASPRDDATSNSQADPK